MLVSPVVACGGPGDDPDASGSTDTVDVRESQDANLNPDGFDGGDADEVRFADAMDDADAVPDTDGLDGCVPDCKDRECGSDGCYHVCGYCEYGALCDDGRCLNVDVPDCIDKECGPDGVGGSCGECLDGRECVELTARCLFPACVYPDELPAAWGKSAILNYLHVPVNSGEESVCRDYTGDGVLDSALSGMASQMNPGFEDIATWNTALVMEFSGVDDFVDTADFVLNGLYGNAVSGSMSGTDVELDDSTYMTDSCMPYIRFAHAGIAGGVVTGSAGRASIFINVAPSFVLQVDLVDVFMGGTVATDGDGVAVTGGSFSAVLTSANYYKAMEDIEAECAKDPVPEGMDAICGAIAMSQPRIVGPGAVLFNMHRNDDGSYINKDAENAGNAASLCLTFTAGPAVITGYRQP